ncbi:MAG TPA: hypothetical protein VLV76_05650 [Candidatus Acidoferrum sp.]|nr:hypothetical protein [Candidatus Acidoferrum sp.]
MTPPSKAFARLLATLVLLLLVGGCCPMFDPLGDQPRPWCD